MKVLVESKDTLLRFDYVCNDKIKAYLNFWS